MGGWITDSFSWRWGFYLIVPIGAAAVVPALIGLPGISAIAFPSRPRLDWPGALLALHLRKAV